MFGDNSDPNLINKSCRGSFLGFPEIEIKNFGQGNQKLSTYKVAQNTYSQYSTFESNSCSFQFFLLFLACTRSKGKSMNLEAVYTRDMLKLKAQTTRFKCNVIENHNKH